MKIVQYMDESGARRIGAAETGPFLRVIRSFSRIYDLARTASRERQKLESLVTSSLSDERVDYDALIEDKRVLPPLDHPDEARCFVSLTGLTYVGSAKSGDEMHLASSASQESSTDSLRIFQHGVAGGKPKKREPGAQPEWAYKGDGRCVVAPEHPSSQPAFAEDGGKRPKLRRSI
jgi:hypothetical protein